MNILSKTNFMQLKWTGGFEQQYSSIMDLIYHAEYSIMHNLYVQISFWRRNEYSKTKIQKKTFDSGKLTSDQQV